MKRFAAHLEKTGYPRLVAWYLAFVFLTLLVFFPLFQRLLLRNNRQQTDMVIGLMAEKVNTALTMMTDYAQGAAALSVAKDAAAMQEKYNALQASVDSMPYISVGLVDLQGRVYGTQSETQDMAKYEFPATAAATEQVYISEPYRSSATGSNVITMFAPCYYGNERTGSVFVTFPFAFLQSVAQSAILENEADVFLLNAFSGNFITCTGSGATTAGTWSNLKLQRQEITPTGSYDFDAWVAAMQNGEPSQATGYKYQGVSYTQAYEAITGMEGWFVVVRIRNEAISGMISETVRMMALFLALLLVATLLLTRLMFWKESLEKKRLQKVSATDPLTKTMNRRAFQSLLEEHFATAPPTQRSVLMFLDIDFFKQVNDTYGHAAGDSALTHFAAALYTVFPQDSIVARIGGDEFIVFLKNAGSRAEIDAALARFSTLLQETPLGDGRIMAVHYSAGLAECPTDADNTEALKKCADRALYHTKEHGRNGHCWYSDVAGTV